MQPRHIGMIISLDISGLKPQAHEHAAEEDHQESKEASYVVSSAPRCAPASWSWGPFLDTDLSIFRHGIRRLGDHPLQSAIWLAERLGNRPS